MACGTSKRQTNVNQGMAPHEMFWFFDFDMLPVLLQIATLSGALTLYIIS